MQNLTHEKSIFDEIRMPEKYGWKGIASILYVLSIQLAVLLFGMAFLTSYISSCANPSPFDSSTFLAPVISTCLILTTVLGAILRGKSGWMLTLSNCYFTFGFCLLPLRNGHYLFPAIGCCIAVLAAAFMHTPYLKRFYQIHVEAKLSIMHLFALLIGILATALMPFALG